MAMKRYRVFITTALITLCLASSAYSAGYMKIGDIKGESTKETPAPTPTQRVDDGNTTTETGLLVPAVQKVRDRPDSGSQETGKDQPAPGKKKGNVEYGWKVEEGEK
jgi:hypothetical protein